MRYLDDFGDKYGFNGGEAIPLDAHAVRTVYAYAFNRANEIAGGDLRLVPFDRPGMHNWLMVFFRPKELVEAMIAADPVKFAMGPGAGGWAAPASHFREGCRLQGHPVDEEIHSIVVGDTVWRDSVYPADSWVNGRNQILWTALKRAMKKLEPELRKLGEEIRAGAYGLPDPHLKETSRGK